MSTMLLFVVPAIVGLLVLILSRHRSGMPPGPPRGFLGDNRRDVPTSHPWKTFKAWNERYGPVVSFFLGSTPVIVLGTAKAASDLLDKRGDIYSGRPRNIIGQEILSGGMRGIGMSYGPRWRKWRSLMQFGMNTNRSTKYQPLQTLEASLLLRGLLTEKDPGQYISHLQRFATSIVFCVAYGRRVKTLKDDIVVANQKIGGYFGKVTVPGKYIVDSWPILLAIPRALQWFRWEPERHRALDTELYMSILNDVKDQVKQGTAQPSMATYALENQEQLGLSDVETAYALSAPWAAGVGTTVASIEVFILAMLLYPAVMRKAQAEIDFVVGQGRLPGFSDSGFLPYTQALIKETTRWRPIAPTGFPHSLMADDTYEGMFMPKGSTVYANIYGIMSDPHMFRDPEEFVPERFLDVTDPKFVTFNMPFGFGRRICPGMHVALQSMFITIVRILWAFDVTPPVGETGAPILPSPHEFTHGLVTRPTPFKYYLIPRNKAIDELILDEADRADKESAAWK